MLGHNFFLYPAPLKQLNGPSITQVNHNILTCTYYMYLDKPYELLGISLQINGVQNVCVPISTKSILK